MTPDELIARLDIVPADNDFRVNARESSDLEFKLELNLAIFKKSLKTIAAFANRNGGCIVFGVRDRPRTLVGVANAVLDDGIQSEQLIQSLSPPPVTTFFTVDVHGRTLAVLHVAAADRRPVIAIRDIQGAANEEQVLRQGVVYTRRRGQTSPISGEEFSQILIARDQKIREEIFSFLSRGKQTGFEKAVVAEAGSPAGDQTGMTFYLPASAAKDLNVIDRARLVQEKGQPAYEIQGTVQLTIPNDNDPRKPKRAADSALQMQEKIRRIFGNDFPWSFSHLKKAADHLGFWPTSDGDGANTGREKLTGTTIYFQAGRTAIENFAAQNPDAFIDVVGSQQTRSRWLRDHPL